MNLVIFSGNLAKDAKVVSTSTGKQFCVTTLALREDLRPDNKPAVFVDIIIWGERATKLVKYLTKGKAISVTGRLEIVKTQKSNYTYVSPRVVVETLEFLGKKSIETITAEENKTAEVSTGDNIPEEEVPF
ncbi:MAG: single-stranded DNA-binding protein [Endomicrobiia bacterium]